MHLFVVKKERDAPKHAEWLDGARGLGAAHVSCLPAELVEDACDFGLRSLVTAADEHRWLAFLELRIDHAHVSDGVEGFHEVRLRSSGLQLLHQRLVRTGKEPQYTVCGRRVL